MGEGANINSPPHIVEGSAPAKKKKKIVRRKKFCSLAVGEGISMEDIPNYAERALVGHARGRNLNQISLNR